MADNTSLAKRIESLEKIVKELTHRLGQSPPSDHLTMKRHQICPKCSHRSFLRVNQLLDNATAGSIPVSINRASIWGTKPEGTFEVFACRNCEFVEWYLDGAGQLDPKTFKKIYKEQVEIIEAPNPESGVFR